MADVELTAEVAAAHARALADIGATVDGAGAAGAARVGSMDFGAMFTPIMALVNVYLEKAERAITEHSAELATHRADFERTVAVLRDADEAGAAGIPR